jgi:hypothetical protein
LKPFFRSKFRGDERMIGADSISSDFALIVDLFERRLVLVDDVEFDRARRLVGEVLVEESLHRKPRDASRRDADTAAMLRGRAGHPGTWRTRRYRYAGGRQGRTS